MLYSSRNNFQKNSVIAYSEVKNNNLTCNNVRIMPGFPCCGHPPPWVWRSWCEGDKVCTAWQILHFNLFSKWLLVWLTDKYSHTWTCSCTATMRKFVFCCWEAKSRVLHLPLCMAGILVSATLDFCVVTEVCSDCGFALAFDSLIFAKHDLTLRVTSCHTFGFGWDNPSCFLSACPPFPPKLLALRAGSLHILLSCWWWAWHGCWNQLVHRPAGKQEPLLWHGHFWLNLMSGCANPVCFFWQYWCCFGLGAGTGSKTDGCWIEC